MHITMLSTRRGCEDGFRVSIYYKNASYLISHSLAISFIQKGWAVQS